MTNKKTFGTTLFATVMMIGLMGTFTATAHADEWNDHERMAREWHHRHHMHDHRPVIVERPNVVYAPPVVVEPPSSGSGGLNITIPLNFN
jgi:hypothetical protein